MPMLMGLEITRKGKLYSGDCAKCGATLYVHEFATWDNNAERDAMQRGTLGCQSCHLGQVKPETFMEHTRPYYAARLSANGYMDCTDWHYGTNRRKLEKEVRDWYGVTK